MTTAAILAFGLSCAAVCAGLSWYSLSMNAIQWRLRRLGIPVDVKIDDLSEGPRDAYMRYLARQQFLAIPAVLTAIAAPRPAYDRVVQAALDGHGGLFGLGRVGSQR